MRSRISSFIVLASSIVACLCIYLTLSGALCGCAQDATAKTTQAHTAYTAALESVHIEYEAGKLTKADLNKLEPYRLAADAALSAMDGYATGDATDWANAFQSFQTAMEAFTSPATTQSSP